MTFQNLTPVFSSVKQEHYHFGPGISQASAPYCGHTLSFKFLPFFYFGGCFFMNEFRSSGILHTAHAHAHAK